MYMTPEGLLDGVQIDPWPEMTSQIDLFRTSQRVAQNGDHLLDHDLELSKQLSKGMTGI